MDYSLATSESIEAEISQKLEAIRLSQNITQSQLATEAGVSRSTITRLAQAGKGISLDSFIRIMRALGLTSQLESLLPDPTVSPLERLREERSGVYRVGKTRKRARPKKPSSSSEWQWGDEAAQ